MRQAAELETFIRSLVERFTVHHEHLTIRAEPVGGVLMLGMTAHASDKGRLIGEQGAHFMALIALARRWGSKRRVSVKLTRVGEVAPGTVEEDFPEFKPAATWPRAEIVQLLKDTLDDVLRDGDKFSVKCTDGQEGSTLAVTLPDGIPDDVADKLAGALDVLFDAIGRSAGRILVVRLRVGDGQPIDQWTARAALYPPSRADTGGQPETADGRFAATSTRTEHGLVQQSHPRRKLHP